ncbi:hypothetical protein J2W55_005153 [Mucilaginibacter pocheonensis]|uniref:Uncharacterized protein n=1 Tax=Mucilaginibacter pocheonensis TaxID=398050 RepID=A0ABU1TK96_9SPHI|nr:hypothetical protein [Mucilaginibacter pocheonensis]
MGSFDATTNLTPNYHKPITSANAQLVIFKHLSAL